MQCIFLCKRGRQDIARGISFLTTRVKKPCQKDWRKLKKVINFLKGSIEKMLTLIVGNKQTIQWCIDALFAVHKDLKSHIGACMILG